MFFDVNILAVGISAVVAMGIGALWYSPLLFGDVWARLMEFPSAKMEEMKKGGVARMYVAGFLLEIVTAVVFFKVIGISNVSGIAPAINLAGLLWLGFMVPILLGAKLWENKPMKLIFINAGYRLAALIAMAVVISFF